MDPLCRRRWREATSAQVGEEHLVTLAPVVALVSLGAPGGRGATLEVLTTRAR